MDPLLVPHLGGLCGATGGPSLLQTGGATKGVSPAKRRCAAGTRRPRRGSAGGRHSHSSQGGCVSHGSCAPPGVLRICKGAGCGWDPRVGPSTWHSEMPWSWLRMPVLFCRWPCLSQGQLLAVGQGQQQRTRPGSRLRGEGAVWEQGLGLSCVGQLGRHFPHPVFPGCCSGAGARSPGPSGKAC